MICAIYARKSTEQNGADLDARSVVRQIESARVFAASRGWTVDSEHTYADDAVSGADVKRLLQRQRLLDLIASGRAPFQALVMRDTSRFSRQDGDEAFRELKAIAQAGLQIWFYQDSTRFEYGTLAANITGFMRAEFAAEYRRQIACLTYDAMQRKARAGHVTGGRVFGYDNVRVEGHVERRINEAEAAVVVRIFEMTAAGSGLKRIAHTLNAERTPCPRARLGRPDGWAPSSLHAILRRTLYRGVITWGRTKQRDITGERNWQKRQESDWITVSAPHLRVVDDALWARAHRRLKAAAETYIRSTNGQIWGRPPTGLEAKYLLTGLTRCASCGSGFMTHVMPGRRAASRYRYYVCTGYHNRGAAVCPNGLRVDMETANDAVLNVLRDHILQPDIVEGAIADALQMLRPSDEQIEAQRADLEGRLRSAEEEVARLAAAIAAGGPLASLLAATRERETQLAHLRQRLQALDSMREAGTIDLPRIEKDLRARLKDWRGLLSGQVAVSRQILVKLLDDRLTFTPQADAYEFTGRVALGKLVSGLVPALPQDWYAREDSNL